MIPFLYLSFVVCSLGNTLNFLINGITIDFNSSKAKRSATQCLGPDEERDKKI